MTSRRVSESHRARALHTTRRLAAASGGALAAVAVAASPAAAHGGGPTRGAADGFLHPLLGPDHLLAMVAVGIVAAVTAAHAHGPFARLGVWAAPLAFVSGMVVGGVLGIEGWSLPAVELAIVLSVIAMGVAVTGAVGDATIWVPLLLLAGLAHGNAHGVEAPGAANPALYVLGFVVATVALHTAGVTTGLFVRRWPVARVAVGASVAAAGMVLLV